MSTDHKTPRSEAAVLVVDDNLAKRLAIASVLEPLGLSRRDPLTGLYNRRGFEDEFERTLAYAYRYDRSGAVLMIDLDGFKDVNDGLGHRRATSCSLA